MSTATFHEVAEDEWDRLRLVWPDLSPWAMVHNKRLTKTLGRTNYRREVIEYGRLHEGAQDPAIVREVIRHEAAHALYYIEDEYSACWFPHGGGWRRWAVRLGAQPRAKLDFGLIKATALIREGNYDVAVRKVAKWNEGREGT